MTDYTSSPSRPASPAVPLPDISTARPLPYRFSWDPTSRRPGPASVSEITEGRGDYFTSTPKVDIYGASSSTATSQLGTVPRQWSSAKHGFHGTFAVCWRMVYFVNRVPRLYSHFHGCQQPSQEIRAAKGSRYSPSCATRRTSSRTSERLRSLPQRRRTGMGSLPAQYRAWPYWFCTTRGSLDD